MNFVEKDFKETIENNFLTYANYVILNRAIPDVRDCLKLSTKQILMGQYVEGITPNNKMIKANKSTSAAMTHFYVHGDASAAGTLIRMGKPFAMRYVLEEVQGNKGTLTSPSNHAADRYLEMRMSPLAYQMMETIDKNSIEEWQDNFDMTEKYPRVFPSLGYYNICNGIQGIRVGIATSIPQFNIKDVNNAIIKLIKNPDCNFDEIYCPVDFATGGIIINESEVKESLKEGKGKSIRIRANVEFDREENFLKVTEMPYGVYTNTICEQLAEIMENNPNCGIERYVDATGLSVDLRIYLTKNANYEKVLKMLYKNTSLESSYSINMIMLEDGKKPKVFGWKEALLSYIKHIRIVKKREINYTINKIEERLEILNIYKKVCDNLDFVIDTIKNNYDTDKIKKDLSEKLNITIKQTDTILNMRLQKISRMETESIYKEYDNLSLELEKLLNIIKNQSEIDKILIKELNNTIQKFGDERRTVNIDLNINSENNDIIEKKNYLVSLTNQNTLYLIEDSSLLNQKRKSVGNKLKLDKNEYVIETLKLETNEHILCLSNQGRAFSIFDKEENEKLLLSNYLNLNDNEKITKIICYNNNNLKNKKLIFVTKNGIIKATNLSEYNSVRKSGIIAIKLKEEKDEVRDMIISDSEDKDVILFTKFGYAVRFSIDSIPTTNRNSIGVIGSKLKNDDEIVSLCLVDKSKNDKILLVTQLGYGKIINSNEITRGSRGNRGASVIKLEDSDLLVKGKYLKNNKENIVLSNDINNLKLKITEIPTLSKTAKGTCLIKQKDNQKISDFIFI